MENHVKQEEEPAEERPTPFDFEKYIPYACHQLQLDSNIIVTKVFQNEYVSAVSTDRNKKNKSRAAQSRHDLGSDQEKEDKSATGLFPVSEESNIVRITAVYDSFNNLVEIRFEKNRQIPQILMKIIGLIVHFHTHLNTIFINGGLNKYTIYEINKFLKTSNITEICLDNSYLKEANYYILLETPNTLRYLSLSKCKINDQVMEVISKKLVYPSPASKMLLILNLSTNRITDIGAKYLAEALRSNRKLSYINLADNRLTDKGAGSILDCLLDFPLTSEEILSARFRHVLFLRDKETMIQQMMKELRVGEYERRQAAKKKQTKPATPVSGKKGKLEKESSLKCLVEPHAKSLLNMESLFYGKAVTMTDNALGDFKDPHGSHNIILKDGILYCQGNNSVLYLNLSYNNLTYLTLTKLLKVLKYQKLLDRQPRGLVNVSIEGNLMPNSCNELMKIDDIIETGLILHSRSLSVSKKKGPPRSTPK